MRRKKGREQEAPAGRDHRITPDDVQQVEFRLAFRGYNERDVDAFLDRVTEDLAAYLEEAERLRNAGGGTGEAAGPTLAAAEAETILARARGEAAEIVREAQREADATRAASGGDPRAAVAPFLSREREFLQGLGSLVQSHAEEVRQMVLAVRTHTDLAAPGAPAEEATGEQEAAPAAEDEEPAAVSAEEPVVVSDAAEPTGPIEDGSEEEPIVVERASEPALSSDTAPAEHRERSLRELFWGED